MRWYTKLTFSSLKTTFNNFLADIQWVALSLTPPPPKVLAVFSDARYSRVKVEMSRIPCILSWFGTFQGGWVGWKSKLFQANLAQFL